VSDFRLTLRSARARQLFLVVVALAAFASAPAWAASPEQQLADRYAPIAALAEQKKPCEKGEAWSPTTVDIVLDNPEVTLRGPAEGSPVVKRAPTAADLFGKGKGYFLDFPGNPLRPGCKYERDGKRFDRGRPPITYAHIVAEPGDPRRFGDPGRLALQYWFFYYFNDFNDKHEADWEGIQLVFEAASAREALRTEPDSIGYAQHEGGERAAWGSDDLEKVGNHPVVYSAAGSHASYYSSALWLGTSASEGFGCDDTRGPSHQQPLGAVLVPIHVNSKSDAAAWLAFEGRWGEKERGANNGPAGPNMKPRWTQPFDWQEDLRGASIEVPAGESLGSVTGAFCGVVMELSSILNFFYGSLRLTIAVLAAMLVLVLALLVWLVRRTSWSPAEAEPIRARRDVGQILRVSRRLYWRRKWFFLGLGVFAFLVAAMVETIKTLLESFLSLFGEFTLAVSSTAFAFLALNAAAAVALTRLDSGRPVKVLRTWWFVVRRFLTLVVAVALELLLVVAVFLLVLGIPFVIGELTGSASTAAVIVIILLVVGGLWLIRSLVGWALTAQEIYVDRCSARAAVRQGPRLVTNNRWRSAVMLVPLYVAGIASGPIVGFAILFLTSADPSTLNLIGSVISVIVFPYIAIATTLLYFDLQERRKGALEPVAAGEPVVSMRSRLRG
jgi:hypothetical protein